VAAAGLERLSAEFVTAAQRERKALAARVQQLRAAADELRGQAEKLENDAETHECLLRELEDVLGIASQMRLDLPQRELGGRRLREVAVEVLRQHGLDEPIHYKDWFELVRAEHRIAGKDPLATFLAQVSRDPNVERVGRKSGRYRLSATHKSNGRSETPVAARGRTS
jgi:hypothetical protein